MTFKKKIETYIRDEISTIDSILSYFNILVCFTN